MRGGGIVVFEKGSGSGRLVAGGEKHWSGRKVWSCSG